MTSQLPCFVGELSKKKQTLTTDCLYNTIFKYHLNSVFVQKFEKKNQFKTKTENIQKIQFFGFVLQLNTGPDP